MYTQLAGGVDREMDWWKVLVFIRGGGVVMEFQTWFSNKTSIAGLQLSIDYYQ